MPRGFPKDPEGARRKRITSNALPEVKERKSIAQKEAQNRFEVRLKKSSAQKEVWDLKKREEHGAIMTEVLNQQEVKEKRIGAALEAMNRPEVKEKSSSSAKKRFENPEERNKQSIRMKGIMSSPELRSRLSEVHLNPEVKSRTAKALTSPGTKSERDLFKIIESIDPGAFILYGGKKFRIGKLFPDFVCESRRQIIELFGDHWHNPEMIGISKEEHELERIEYFSEYGWETLIVWEQDFYNNIEEVKRRLLSFVQR